MLAASLLAALVLALALPDVRRVTWPDGTPREEYECEVDAGGRERRSGTYRSWHANGQLASEGTFAQDAETGRWRFFREDGAVEAEGSFARGMRTGVWTSYHPNGQRAARGRYDDGRRAGEWTFWTADGKADASSSGVWEHRTVPAGDGQVLEGYLVDGVRHGEWTSRWPDGSPQATGTFERGVPSGEWRFRHLDGSFSSQLSARYAAGELAGTLEPGAAERETALPLPAPEAGPLGWPRDAAAVAREIDGWLDVSAEELAARAKRNERPPVLSEGVRVIPVALKRLQALDAELPEDRERMARLARLFLEPLCGGRALVALPARGPDSAAEAREFVRAWSSAWAATKHDLWFWLLELDSTEPRAGAAVAILSPPLPLARPYPPAHAVPALYARRFEPRDGSRTEAALQAALAWLEGAQRADGSWDSRSDHPEFAKHSAGFHDSGITALAALALLGAGRTPDDCPALVRAVAYVVGEIDPRTGTLDRRTHDWIYDHSMMTLALCEALALRPSAVVREAAQRLTDTLLAARNPEGAWRYDLPPDGTSDTSITGWAVAAVHAARAAGLAGDFDAAIADAASWIDLVTDPATGVVGYETVGTQSARTPLNEDFPREHGEALTAVGLFVRRIAGRSAPKDPMIEKHIKLLRAKPPRWDPASKGIDEYYWYYGALALALCGEPHASAWDAALFDVARAQNGNPEHRGSWDPVGAWSMFGGRPMTTALIALALESRFRYALADEPAGKKKKR